VMTAKDLSRTAYSAPVFQGEDEPALRLHYHRIRYRRRGCRLAAGENRAVHPGPGKGGRLSTDGSTLDVDRVVRETASTSKSYGLPRWPGATYARGGDAR